MAAYHSVATYQAFLGWSIIRTGLEAALMMGKWVDDPRNAEIWANRDRDWKAYAKLFQGRALQSEALPQSARIQQALKRVNDLFLHPNPSYYYRHLAFNDLEGGSTELRVEFFDERVDAAVGILGILHLVVFVQDAIANMFATLFGGEPIEVGLPSLEGAAESWVRETMLAGPGPKDHLIELGLWTAGTAL